MRFLLVPSLFFSSLLFLNAAKEATRSMMPQSLATFLMNLSLSSHFEPKLDARNVSVSLVYQSSRSMLVILLASYQYPEGLSTCSSKGL